MHDQQRPRDRDSGRAPDAPVRPRPDGVLGAGNRALGEALGARPVQRWPDLDDLAGYLPDAPTLPDMPTLPDLPSLPSIPQMPTVKLGIDTAAGTASGGIDFGGGSTGSFDYSSTGGLGGSVHSGTTDVSGHAGGPGPWGIQGQTTSGNGNAYSGSLSGSSGGGVTGEVSTVRADGTRADAGGHAGGFGPPSGHVDYHGGYGDVDLGTQPAVAPQPLQLPEMEIPIE
jgi:hypothetical protein